MDQLGHVPRPHQPAARRIFDLAVGVGQVSLALRAHPFTLDRAHGVLDGQVRHVIGTHLAIDHDLARGGVVERHTGLI